MTNQTLENRRKTEQDRRNEQRFDAYNIRRISAGFTPLAWSDFLARRYGMPSLMRRIDDLAAKKPQHRDNVVLFSR